MKNILILLAFCGLLFMTSYKKKSNESITEISDGIALRPRVRDLGVKIGIFQPGRYNAITDVPGVKVGQISIILGQNVRTGVTAIWPHSGNIFREKLPAAIYVGNGFGKLIGYTQVEELGQIETPIILTNTLSVWQAADALVKYMLQMPDNATVRSINPVVGETNDGWLNDIRSQPVQPQHVWAALDSAKTGAVDEGCVGAGIGTTAFGWKAGIGTASRKLPEHLGEYVIGVLVQTNMGGDLRIDGIPVGKLLQKKYLQKMLVPQSDGSCMIVIATDAPLDARQLKRLARRAMLGLARTGSPSGHGSGDYVIAFSVAKKAATLKHNSVGLTIFPDSKLTPLFQAVVEATEEAIINSLLKATTTIGHNGHKAEALPIERVREILQKFSLKETEKIKN